MLQITLISDGYMKLRNYPVKGKFGKFGGRFVPETLIPALEELENSYDLIDDNPVKKVIKQGKAYHMSDDYGRDARDRLQHEERVYQELHGKIPCPFVDKYFVENEHGYLPMEFINGSSFMEFVRDSEFPLTTQTRLEPRRP